MATLATPAMDISRGRTVQRTKVVISVCDIVFDQTPILSTRLVDDNGDRITGVLAREGSWPVNVNNRSCTTCRAAINSAFSSKIATTDDNPSTDLDRKVLNPLTPLTAFSMGVLTRASTSEVESPGASV